MAPPQWAYQVENYVTEPDEELVCSICRAVFCDPGLCPCDHVFCKECITKWLQNNRNCPICRKRVSNTSIKQTVPIIKNLIMKLMLNCHNKSLGCKAQFSVEKSEAHVKECEYEFVQCKNVPCADKLFRKDIVEHETKDCPHRYTQCEKCKCKMPSSTKLIEKHSCIKALHSLVKEKKEIIQKQKDHIKELEKEIETLKATLQDTGRSRMPGLSRDNSTSSTLSSISPDEITINIREYDSQSSISSDSDMSSDSFYIFTNEPLPNDNEESDSFSTYMDDEDNTERENSHAASEYCNAVTQTDNSNYHQDEGLASRNDTLAHENDSTIVEVPNSVFGEVEEPTQSRKPAKRRPTTEKPAKRRLHPQTLSTTDDDDDDAHLPSRSSKKGMRLVNASKDEASGTDRREDVDSYMEAGPSSASTPVSNSRTAISDNSKSKNRSRSKSKQKRAKQAGNYVRDNAVSSSLGVTSDNRVFQRTLALLEQYNLESDPEWLPEYASHRGNTTSESDSSDLVESSNSELSDVGSQRERFMNWMFDDCSSEDDPDWRPPGYSNSLKEN